MNRHYSYAQINCRLAVDHMAASPQPLRKRIAAAYLGYIYKLRSEQVPEKAREDLHILRTKFTKIPARFPAEGSVEASLTEMNWRELHVCARIIVELSHKLDNVYFEEVL